jgi:hypothetical protein
MHDSEQAAGDIRTVQLAVILTSEAKGAQQYFSEYLSGGMDEAITSVTNKMHTILISSHPIRSDHEYLHIMSGRWWNILYMRLSELRVRVVF